MKLYGKNPVLERIKFNPRSIRKIYIQNGHSDAGYIYKKAKKWGLPVMSVPKSKIMKVARNVNAQGIVVEVDDYEYMDLGELISAALKKKLTLIFLDGLNDPQNLGGIIRSLACLGGFALVLPGHGSVGVTETVLRVACGGENYVPVSQVSNIGKAIREAREEGFFIAGAVVDQGEPLMSAKLDFPLGLVIGSEQKGIRPVIRKLLDQHLTLPMAQARLSLNAAHAASIFAYEISRQKQNTGNT
ncbi:MAG: TrmH family RNA methyltransferase [Candidatus Omnitrophota bacterium]